MTIRQIIADMEKGQLDKRGMWSLLESPNLTKQNLVAFINNLQHLNTRDRSDGYKIVDFALGRYDPFLELPEIHQALVNSVSVKDNGEQPDWRAFFQLRKLKNIDTNLVCAFIRSIKKFDTKTQGSAFECISDWAQQDDALQCDPSVKTELIKCVFDISENKDHKFHLSYQARYALQKLKKPTAEHVVTLLSGLRTTQDKSLRSDLISVIEEYLERSSLRLHQVADVQAALATCAHTQPLLSLNKFMMDKAGWCKNVVDSQPNEITLDNISWMSIYMKGEECGTVADHVLKSALSSGLKAKILGSLLAASASQDMPPENTKRIADYAYAQAMKSHGQDFRGMVNLFKICIQHYHSRLTPMATSQQIDDLIMRGLKEDAQTATDLTYAASFRTKLLSAETRRKIIAFHANKSQTYALKAMRSALLEKTGLIRHTMDHLTVATRPLRGHKEQAPQKLDA